MKSATSTAGIIPPYNNRIFGAPILSFMLRVTFILLRNIFPFKNLKSGGIGVFRFVWLFL